MRTLQSVKSIVEQTISLFDLNLKDKTVLTEAANGHFYITPIIAALAGANVIAIAKDSAYGKSQEVCEYVKEKAAYFGLEDKITLIENELNTEQIKKADIITNLGFVRPIDEKFIGQIKSNAVIAGMCEDWEIRSKDIDLSACTTQGIPVVAVHEQSPKLDIFKYVGLIAVKMIFELGLELYRNRFLIVSRDKFGVVISDTLSQMGAGTSLVEKLDSQNAQLIESQYDAVIMADYSSENKKDTIVLDSLLIKRVTHNPLLIHLAGEVNYNSMKEKGIQCFPKKDGHVQKMSETFAYLGIRPVVELHTAGLAVAKIVLDEKTVKQTLEDIESNFHEHPLVSICNKPVKLTKI